MNPMWIQSFIPDNEKIGKLAEEVTGILHGVAKNLDENCMVFKNNLVKPTDVSKYNFCGWSVDLDTDMEDAEEKCRKVITAEKFGIVSCVDVQKTLKKKVEER